MDFLNEVAGKKVEEFAPGDSSLLSAEYKRPEYKESDIPGYLNPVVNGEPDTSQYVLASDADQAAQSGVEAQAVPRSQALAMLAKADGVQNPSEKDTAAALAKRKKKPEEPKPDPNALEYPL